VRIITATLMQVAMMASLMINLEKEIFLLNAIRQAMKDVRFNTLGFVKNMVLWYCGSMVFGIRKGE